VQGFQLVLNVISVAPLKLWIIYFFLCPIAKVIWGLVALCFGIETRRTNYNQFWLWNKKALPGGGQVYMLGIAAICWTLWKARNKTCFEKKQQLKALLKLCSQLVLSYNIGQGSIPKMRKQWTGSEDPEEEWTGGASSTDWSRASRIVEEDDTLRCR
jgi:hypothetical protein